MKRAAIIVALLANLMPVLSVHSETPGLQLNPLQYEDNLTTNSVHLGYVDVSNPSDAIITIESKVQGFKQTDIAGHLGFFDDPEITGGIKVDLARFDLGPHEAIRVAFSVDPQKLPKGGVYAVIFFRTIPPQQSSASSFVAESANIGTLLMLQNGGSGAHVGKITKVDLPFLQFGRGLLGTFDYKNIDRSITAVGFKPAVSVRVLPWGSSPKLASALVLPSSERRFEVDRRGSFFGILPVTLTDTDSHQHVTTWVFALTGWYQLVLIIIVLTLGALAGASYLRKRQPLSQPDAALVTEPKSKAKPKTKAKPEPKTKAKPKSSTKSKSSTASSTARPKAKPKPKRRPKPKSTPE